MVPQDDITPRDDVVPASLEAIGHVTGLGYDRVARDLGEVCPSRGLGIALVCEYLALLGFATQPVGIHDALTRNPREDWPPRPWTDAHVAVVERGVAWQKGFVVLLGDGTVLDAMWEGRHALADYERVIQVVGVHRVGASPCGAPGA